MTHRHKTRFCKLMAALLALPMLQSAGCFSDDDVRAIIANVVSLSLDVAEVAINNLIEQSLLFES